MNGLYVDLAKALFATIVVEEIVALSWKRSFRLATVVFWANVATNPAINLAMIYCPDYFYSTAIREKCWIAAAELGVFGVETAIFGCWGKLSLGKALAFAATLNAASYFAGYPLEKLGYWS